MNLWIMRSYINEGEIHWGMAEIKAASGDRSQLYCGNEVSGKKTLFRKTKNLFDALQDTWNTMALWL